MTAWRSAWTRVPDEVARQWAGQALDQLRKRKTGRGKRGKGKGPFSDQEIRQLIADVLGLSQETGLSQLNRRQCEILVARLINLGMI